MRPRAVWLPAEPSLPAPKLAAVRALLAGAGVTPDAVESCVRNLARCYSDWEAITAAETDALNQAACREYIARAAKASEVVQSAIWDIPQEVVEEMQRLLGNAASEFELTDELERAAETLLRFTIDIKSWLASTTLMNPSEAAVCLPPVAVA